LQPLTFDQSIICGTVWNATAASGGIISKLRRWNISNSPDDFSPDDPSAAAKNVPKTNETKHILVSALKVYGLAWGKQPVAKLHPSPNTNYLQPLRFLQL